MIHHTQEVTTAMPDNFDAEQFASLFDESLFAPAEPSEDDVPDPEEDALTAVLVRALKANAMAEARERWALNLFASFFVCMETEEVPLTRAIDLVRRHFQEWKEERTGEIGPVPVEAEEFFSEVWAQAVVAANDSFDKMVKLASLGRD